MSPDNYDVVGVYSKDLNELYAANPDEIFDIRVNGSPFEQIEFIIDNFDFRKCNRVCKLLRWKYDFWEKVQRIPNELEMRNIARDVMYEAISETRLFTETTVARDYCFMATYDGVTVRLYYVMVSA